MSRKRNALDAVLVMLVGIGYLMAGAAVLWLAWLGLSAFFLYGYHAIVWILS